MDIKYKDKHIELSIKNINKNSILTNEELGSVMKIINAFKHFEYDDTDNEQQILNNVFENVEKEQQEHKEKQSVSYDRPIIRDRLPNQIDLSELEIKKAMTTEPMIRCPYCGQASKVIVHIGDTKYASEHIIKESNVENYLLRKVFKGDKETFETVLKLEDNDDTSKICKPETADIMDYHKDIMKIKIPAKLRDTDLNVTNDTLLKCPICRKTNTFSKWVEAFKHPLEFGFETECLCDICGHEAVASIDKNKNKIIKCEHCGFEKPAL